MQVEELDLVLGEAVHLAQRDDLLLVDLGHLRLQADHQRRRGDDEVLAQRGRVAPGLQPAGHRVHVVRVLDALPRRAARLAEADQQVGVPDVGELLLVHVLEQEVLGLGELVRRVARRCTPR